MERRGRRRKYKLDGIKETREYTITEKKRSTVPNSVENWLWKSLWTCRKTDYVMKEYELQT